MDFSKRKLPKDAARNLVRVPIYSVKPYRLMLAPVYVYLRRNEKFVSVKAPLDFFTPEELDHYRTYESFFHPEFINSVSPFAEAGRGVRRILSWAPRPDLNGVPQLPPAPYEISDSIIRWIGPLWGAKMSIEPFFITAFVEDLCTPISDGVMKEAREKSVADFEEALLRSSWCVFLGLHLGYCDLEFLDQLRLKIFQESLQGRLKLIQDRLAETDEDELIQVACATLENGKFLGLNFGERSERVSHKLADRLKRIESELISKRAPIPSIFGEKGFVDV